MIRPDVVELAFSGGSFGAEDALLNFRTESAGNLVVLSGRIAASDPLVDPNPRPFTRPVPVGEYPVSLAIAVHRGGDERVAFARVEFGSGKADHWEMACIGGQDPRDLKDTEIFGYGVDAGTGCFMDAQTTERLTERMSEKEDYYEDIIELLDRTYRHTWSWANFKPKEGAEGNVVAFSTGYGDGLYASYFGLNNQGKPLCLVTDFAVACSPTEAEGHQEIRDSSPNTASPKRQWWRFW